MFPTTLVTCNSPRKAVHHSTKEDVEAKRQKAAKIVPINTDELTTMESRDILDVLLPPKIAEKNGQYWFQCVSRAPATPTDLRHLQEKLDDELLRQEAREIGICPIRSELYEQCFEELIRQEIVVCPERGRLLRMIQLESKLSQTATISGYESALGYGIQKKLIASKQVDHLTAEVTKLLSRLSELESIQQDLEKEMPKVKEEGEARAIHEQKLLDEEERKILRENELLLKQMMECVEINIQIED
ncbi:putative inner dynein arm light chain, axonemal [Nephila pilipes]|uniref:Putative inner dynein arm light chain, axonemal n=1 Tax=Nephila pilipes TaxID=299642 RepID=A0A8X6N2N3_NEPPI|nr:putative inner dynein arm light chain, axonemal [Nephila pilipes]GFU33928.1 putative inner dynein arm light chain, axonemal [Nephila pilipes]